MAKRTQLHPQAWPKAAGASYAQGVDVGSTVYVSGQVSANDQGEIVGAPDDMRTQALQTFNNVEKVLAEAGLTLNDVVNLTCYITDISKYADYAAVRAEIFTDNLPASATVVVAGLVVPGLLIEISAIAVR
ncbi:MAG: RidA family protein [Chloroflexi bacterium]|jgi:2-iminobutanoate/2-iminopropanoate deaminase|nr:RidA family protein [Chloroflexota bacterium]